MNELRKHIYRRTALLGVLAEQQGNSSTAEKAKKFGQKLFSEQLTIAFAGHFSAGKSSMINALTGENLLATSPIPTSANIVTIQRAKTWKAYVHFINGDLAIAEEELAVANLKRMAKDGQSVRKIELFHPETTLPQDVVLMDTPGVDSTDDAHRLSTESELHLADLVFYVMDYNHVQSELNFTFTKDLMRTNPNVYLIVNQMDKHREQELSIEEYKQSVKTSFESWGVLPKGIFFTSLRKPDLYPVDSVKNVIDSALQQKETVLEESAQGTLVKLVQEHEAFLQEQQEEVEATYEELFSQEEWQDKSETKKEVLQAVQSFELLDLVKWKNELQQQVQQVMSNAYVMTPEVREAVRLYAEASDPGFKMGFFSSKKKIEEERTARLSKALSQLQHVYNQTTAPHIESLVVKYAQIIQVPTDTYRPYTLEASVIGDEFKPGTSATGDGLLQFSSRIEQALKKKVVQRVLDWAEEMTEESDGKQLLSEDNQFKKQQLVRKQRALEEWEAAEQKKQDFSLQIKSPNEAFQKQRAARVEMWEQQYKGFYSSATPLTLSESTPEVEKEIRLEQTASTSQLKEQQVLSRADRLLSLLSDIPNFKEAIREMKQKRDRINNRSFTIALFGAFSAGKSSFSNALLGDAVLPVSPNPTTASINKISPISAEKPHRNADVQFKTVENLLAELKGMIAPHGKEVQTLDELYGRAEEFLQKPLDETKKSFIRAFVTGYPEQKDYLGTIRLVEHQAFTEYVAVESKSCFVETITYYYDCELTRAGVTLVDTPGADSINARHTGVAFDYIRNADAVLFITYFNHAFAKADREFLIQLGRVKDSFEMDKMFFIVNAIDLANTDEEKQDVLDYVEQELTQFGIRFPRLYGVSSLQALEEKQSKKSGASGMPEFEEAFQHFLKEELLEVILQSVDEQAIELTNQFSMLIDSTEENMKRKPQRLAELSEVEQQLRSRYKQPVSETKRNALLNEVETLIYYLQQRLFYRYPDFFKEAFNPSRFSKQDVRSAFESSLHEVVESLEFDTAQELRVTNLRLQQATEKAIRDYEKQERAYLAEQPAAFSVSPMELKAPKLLEFDKPELPVQSYEPLRKHVKNAKRFFEKNEKAILQAELETKLKVDVSHHLEQQTKRLRNWTEQQFNNKMEASMQRFLQTSLTTIAAERELLEQQATLEAWKKIRNQLEETNDHQ